MCPQNYKNVGIVKKIFGVNAVTCLPNPRTKSLSMFHALQSTYKSVLLQMSVALTDNVSSIYGVSVSTVSTNLHTSLQLA